ncbi:hypothetical protein P3342_002641 [Pyrenophora teres f. teres]|nr:hypothetical protein P3342_002641 [Pyrenophora teres f. teres]
MTKTLVLNGARRVYIIGRRESILRFAAESIDPNVVIPIQGDVTNIEELKEISAIITQQEGSINLLIANAGIMGPRPLKTFSSEALSEQEKAQQYASHALATPMEDFTKTYHVNVSAVYYTAMAFLPLLVAGNENTPTRIAPTSQIITTSSIAGFSRLPGASFAYNSSKAAVTHMSKMLASALVGVRVRCNVLAPGVFPTDMTPGIIQGLSGADDGKVDRGVIPVERVGSEEDIAGAVLWMVGRAGAYLNGSVVVVDGGRLGVLPSSY